MASGSLNPGQHTDNAEINPGADHEVERFIESQLRATRSRVKLVDVADVGMLLVVGSLVYLFALVIAEHWFIAGGLNSTARFVAFGLLAAVWGYYSLRRLFPSLFGRVNPLYAAQQIEQARPTLKNSLINFLQLQRRSSHVAPAIYNAIEHRAANDLASVELDHTVDRTRLVRLALALAAIVTIGAIYKVVSPKDPLRSMARVVAPWADWSAPTRVSIVDITPGDSQEFIGQRVKISCRVTGLWRDEAPVLTYSTADGHETNREVRLSKADEAQRYFVELPDSSGGLQQDLIYSLRAGDAQSRPFKLQVVTVPALIVERVRYKYPAYTQLAERTIERQGDLRAIEGTEVTIEALANDTIKSADLDYERDGAGLVRMSFNERRANVRLTLRMKPGTTESEHRSYQLLFKNPAGAGNPSPIGYQIETIADAPPQVAIVEPVGKPGEPIELPLGRALQLSVSAHDSDFRLGSVSLLLDRDGKSKTWLAQPLLTYDHKASEESRPARFEGSWLFDTAKLRPSEALKPGDVVGVVAEATDNKQPKPNVVRSERLLVRIVSPSSAEPPQQDQLANNDPRPGAKPDEAKPKPGDMNPNGDQPMPGDNKSGDKPQAGGKAADNKPMSGDSKPGDMNPNGDKSQAGDNKPGEKNQPGDKNGAGDKPMPGDNKPGDMNPNGDQPQAAENKPGEKNQPGDKNQPGEQGKPGEQSKPGDNNQAGAKPDGKNGQAEDPKGNLGNEQPGNGKPNENTPAGEKQQPGQGNEQRGGNKPEAGQKPGQQQEQGQVAGDGKRVDPQANPGEAIERINKHFGDDKQLARNEPRKDKNGGDSERQQGNNQTGDKQPAANQPQAGGSAAEKKQPGENKPGEQQPGENKPGQGNQPGQKPGDMPPQNGQPQAGGSAAEKKQPGDNKPGDQPGQGQQPGQGDQPGQPKPGQGGQTGDKPGQQPGQQGDKSGQQGGMNGESQNSGTPGSGQSGKQPNSSTSPQGNSKGTDKPMSDSPGDGNKNNDGSSPSRSNQDSDSRGDSSGDQSGGGKEGGGQKSNQAGTGAAGSNTAADQGGSQAEGKGDGPVGSKGGDQAKAGQPSGGKSSGEKGPGSQSRPGGQQPGGEQPGQTAQQGQGQPGGSGKPSDKQAQQAQNNTQNSDSSNGKSGQGGGTGPAQGDGKPGERTIPADSLNGPEPGGDDANLEYARKATELAVQRLKDQLAKGEPDPELLRQLAWTKEDAQKFVAQWEAMMKSAQTSGPDANTQRRELDEKLRSLGLRPSGTALSGNRAKSDDQRGLREGARSAPPSEYADQFKAFTSGTGKKAN